MAKNLDQIIDNLKQASAWIRVLFMIGFALVLYIIIAPVIFVLSMAQALFVLITGDSNQNLRYLGASLARYVQQNLEFLSYNSDLKPFPFSDFPIDSGELNRDINKDTDKAEKAADPAATVSKASDKSAASKKATKRKVTTKKTKSNSNKAADVESGSADG